MGLSTYSYSSPHPLAGVYSQDRIYTTPSVERSPYQFTPIHFKTFTCATLLRRDVSSRLPNGPADISSVSSTLISQAKYKGLGMFAKRALAPGGVVLIEHPLLVVAQSHDDVSKMLGEKETTQFMALANSKYHEYDREVDGIMQTNAVEVALPTEDGMMNHHAVFLNLSRCNHSCSPNAHWRWNATTFAVTLEAVRPIKLGEEITIQYIDTCIDYRQRRDKLASLYGFDCLCISCSQPAHDHSDEARRELRNLSKRLPTFESWCSSKEMPNNYLINLSARALQLRDAEGLQLFQSRKHIDDMAMCFAALEEVELFRAYVEKAMECRKGGPLEHRLVLECWLENPAHFPVWGMRGQTRLY